MKIERTKNATRNIFYGTVSKVYRMAVMFLMRTAMIYFMGVQYLGLNGLFVSILEVLNLAELGVGTAMVYSMYRPIAENDTETICALMKLYRRYYRIIGLVIAGMGILLLPFIPKLIEGEIPRDVNIYILFLLNLGATVLSYWLFAYKNCLLQAHQRNDVASKVSLVIYSIQYAAQFIILALWKNYYVYMIAALFAQVLSNIVTAIAASRLFPDYRAAGEMPEEKVRELNGRIRDLFTSRIGMVVMNSADTIVISAFLGLTTLAVYQNYFYILNSIVSFVAIIFGACTAGIGNSMIVEAKEKNFRDFEKLTFIIAWIAGVCTCVLLCLYQPFMKIWVGEELQLNFMAVVCFCVYYFVIEMNQLLNTYKDAAGIWHRDRMRPLVTSLVNLGINLILVQIWGIYGVLLSTVFAAVFVGMPWLLNNLFSTMFEKKELPKYVRKLLIYAAAAAAACVCSYAACCRIHLADIPTLALRFIICFTVPNVFFFLIYHRSNEFRQSIELLNRITNGKL